MAQVSDLASARDALLGFSPRRPPGHDSVASLRGLLRHLGDPHLAYDWVHVAGTSGKTSTAYHVRQLLEASGRRTGLTVSPYVVGVNERVQVDGGPLPEARFVAAVDEFLPLARAYGRHLTYFELGIALALWTFAREQVEHAVVEVGVGGTRDATNALQRPDKLCVVGAVGLDHTEHLGGTLAEVAAHKAGIVGPGNTAVVARQRPEVMDVVLARVAAQGGRAVVVEAADDVRRSNAALAEAAVRELARRHGFEPVVPDHLDLPPGRFETLTRGPVQVVLDGAHNPQKMAGLVGALRAGGTGGATVLCTLMAAPDHKLDDTLAALAPITSHLVVTGYRVGSGDKTKQSFPSAEVAAAARRLGLTAEVAPDLDDGLRRLLERPGPHLVTGSLYLVSLAREALVAAGFTP